MFNLTKLMILFVLGAIEGITEFLPISSTGHMILIEYFLNYIDDSMQIFTIVVQLGAILSIFVIFSDRLYCISFNCIPKFFFQNHYNNNHLCIRHILISTLPGIIFGMYFYEKIQLLLFQPIYIIYGLISGGFFLLIGEYYFLKLQTSPYHVSDINQITYIQAFLIGCFQCLAFWPGFSRSGATIAGGLLVGLNRRVSSEFSFFLAIPIIFGSITLTIYHHRLNLNLNNVFMLIIGCATSFIISMIVIRFFLIVLQRFSLIPFVIYRFLLAAIIFWNRL